MTRRYTRGTVVAATVLMAALALLVAGAAAGLAADDGLEAHSTDAPLYTADEELVHECAAEPPDYFADPPDGNDTIGWFDGYWYNEPLEIDAEDGLTQDELDEVSKRTAARFEAMRCLTFDSLPPVEIMDREEFAAETEAQYADVDEASAQFDNAQFEAMLTISSDEDAVEVRQADRAAVVGGYYDFINDEVVVISDDPDQLQLDEAILAHELGHALQNQHFDLAQYERPTQDLDNAKLGVIEGDVHRIEDEYLAYCEEELWNEPCILDDSEQDDPQEPPSWGLYFMQFQPYTDGQNFVDHVYEDGGWDAVDALYEDMPNSSVDVIYPERYGEFEPADLEVEDRSSEDWERLDPPQGPDYNVIGQAGLSAMFMGQSYEAISAGQNNNILEINEFLPQDPENPINYDLEQTSGWAGDRLYAYGETDGDDHAVVWKLAWEDEQDLTDFVRGYEELAEARGGEPVEGTAHTYAFGDGSDFDMAVTLYPDEDRLWIVTAPTTDDLTAVHDEIEVLDEGASPLPQDDPTDDADEGDDADETDETDDAAADDTIPGFGVVVAASGVAFVVVGLALTRVRDQRS